MSHPRVRDFMTAQVVTISPKDRIERAAEIMKREGFRHLPVIEGGKVTGLVSERELKVSLAFKEYTLTVGETMTPAPFTLEPDRSLRDAVLEMARRKIGACVVADNGKPVGIFTAVDALEYLGSLLAEGPSRESGLAQPESRIPLSRFMTPDPRTARADDFVLDAADTMRTHGHRHLPVLDRDGTLVGIISDRDVKLATSLLPDEDDLRVEDVMSPEPYALPEGADIGDALAEMERRKLGAAIAMGPTGRVSGIFTAVDAMRAFRVLRGALAGK